MIRARLPVPVLFLVLVSLGAAIAVLGVQTKMIVLLVAMVAVVFLWTKPEYGIFLFLLTFLFTYPDALKGSGIFTINNALGALFCALLLYRAIHENDFWFLKVPQVRLMLAIGAVLLISTWFARNPPDFLMELDRTKRELWDYFTQLAFLIFMINFIKTEKHLKFIVGLFLVVIVMTGLSALMVADDGDYRAHASFGIKAAGNSNRLGFYCLVGVAMFWYLGQEAESRVRRGLLLAGSALLLLVAIMTASRSVLVTALLFGCILAVEAGISPRRIVATGLVIWLFSFLVLNAVPKQNLERITAFDVGSSLSGRSEARSSAKGRLAVAKMALQIYWDSNLLLGVGPGNFRWIRQLEYDLKRLSTHNGYLWALLAGGLFGLGLYLLLFWVTWRDLRWMERQRFAAWSPPVWIVKSMRTTLLLFLSISMFAEVWLNIMPFFIIGTTIVLRRLYMKNSERSVRA